MLDWEERAKLTIPSNKENYHFIHSCEFKWLMSLLFLHVSKNNFSAECTELIAKGHPEQN